jgi:tellurite resistance protein TerC
VGETSLLLWLGFSAFIVAMLALDLGVFSRRAHDVSFREAAIWSAVWIGLALTFNLGLYFWRGQEVALQFFTGYLIEKTLSVDNIFVFVLIFSALAVPSNFQRRLLSLGVIGALVMRALLIFAGTALITQFHWIIYIFGVFLVITGVRLFFQQEHGVEPEENPVVRLARRVFPVTPDYDGDRFVVRRGGRIFLTPLLIALLAVESADLIFATRFLRSSPSRRIRFSSSPPTPSRSWGCAPFTSCSPGRSPGCGTSSTAWRRRWSSSG